MICSIANWSVVAFPCIQRSNIHVKDGGEISMNRKNKNYRRLVFLYRTTILQLFEDSGKSKKTETLSVDEIGAALKEALRVGTRTVTDQLGRRDGFNKDPAVHIPLPENLHTVKSALTRVGMSQFVDDLEIKRLFLQAIDDMTVDDVKGIYNGPKDAATRYFQEKMTPSLAIEMRPVVDESLSTVGAIQAYDTLMGQYRSIPFVPDVKADLTEYVIEKGMDGIFYYLAKEEAAIRQNPAKRTTELLKQVFGSR
jgi:hypothetical protein